MSDPILDAAMLYDPAGRVAVDQPCLKCGYNLRMQPADGRCPECAQSVQETMTQRLLRLADPQWVRQLSSGVNLLLISFVVGLLGQVIAILITQFVDEYVFGPLGSAVANLLGVWLFFQGLQRLSAPDPRSAAWAARHRRLLVILSVAILFLAIVQFLMTLASQFGAGMMFDQSSPLLAVQTSHFLAIAMVCWSVLAATLWFSVPLVLYSYFVQLMRRVPSAGLVRYARIQFWVWLVGCGFALIGFIVVMLIAATVVRSFPTPALTTTAPTTMTMTLNTGGPTTTSATATATFSTSAPTTMPTSFPTSMPFGRRGLGMTGFLALGGCAPCLLFLSGISGLVLTILVARTLSRAARESALIHAAAQSSGAGAPSL